eukprot:TRINITY_DN78201_c0_g1_i1.p1 TRINITY_DN78201_c0_g1~~TRINITY_DN78201_c0_g1_i1.p1  ORF type:complete len:487 (+),score=112.35 TRINITY_DN78201_c0_g1_i1:84-1544(+)
MGYCCRCRRTPPEALPEPLAPELPAHLAPLPAPDKPEGDEDTDGADSFFSALSYGQEGEEAERQQADADEVESFYSFATMQSAASAMKAVTQAAAVEAAEVAASTRAEASPARQGLAKQVEPSVPEPVATSTFSPPSPSVGSTFAATSTPTASPASQVSPLEGLEALRERWLQEIRPDFMPAIESDPYLSPRDLDAMLSRFLRAEMNQKSKDPVATAVARLRETAVFRRDYCCIDFHRRGMARRLFMHGTNAGASVYFADYGLRDLDGEPVLVGRISLMVDDKAPGRKPADKMIPCTHIRAAVFVAERAAVEVRRCGGSYILDLGAYPAADMVKYSNKKYWDADGVINDSAAIKQRRAPQPSVGPHLPSHETMPDGLPTLKEALRILTTHYPGLMKRIYFYRPGYLFRAVFKIFSLWVPPDTRAKFVMVHEGEERKHFLAPGVCDPADVPTEMGGSGASLDGDRFLLNAIERYDATATLEALSDEV